MNSLLPGQKIFITVESLLFRQVESKERIFVQNQAEGKNPSTPGPAYVSATKTSPFILALPTAIPGVTLRQLTGQDTAAYYTLIQKNRAFLTRYGDYQELVQLTAAGINGNFSTPTEQALRMGIWQGQALAGQVDLTPVAPGVFVLGFWLGQAHTGQGIMPTACKAILEYACQTRPVKEFLAGVRLANVESAAVVERFGFSVYEILPDRKRGCLKSIYFWFQTPTCGGL